MQFRLDGSILECIKCKSLDLRQYRESLQNYSNQKGESFFSYFLQCNKCQRHFQYFKKTQTMRHIIQTKEGPKEDSYIIAFAAFVDLENEPNYGIPD